VPRKDAVLSVNALAVAVGLLLAATACLARVASAVPALSPAGLVADTAATTAPPGADGSPTPAEIAVLRQRVERHVVRVRLGQDLYDIHGARFDTVGIAFDSRGLRACRAFADYEPRPPLPSSPIAWDRIDRITVQKPCGTRGAVVGAVVGLGGMVALGIYANTVSHGEPGPGILIIYAVPPIGAVTGSAIGAFITRSEPGWQRGAEARASRGGPVAPAGGPVGAGGADTLAAPPTAVRVQPLLPLGVLRDNIGRHAIRLRVGEDRYEIRDARLEPSGIAFDAGRLRTLPSSASAGIRDRGSQVPPVSSPIAWDRINRIEVRVPSALRGATWGMILLPVALWLWAGTGVHTGGGSDLVSLGGAVLVGVPMGALVGAGAGALVHHSKLEWDRSASAHPAPR